MGKDLHSSVGRPREFDEEVVLRAVMEAFWRNGYEATSLADLCECTGLNKGSLYQAFGDKHQLFMRALTHYAETDFREVAAVASQADSPLARIKAVVRKICEDAGAGKGCMMVNSLVELAPHDPEVKAMLQAFGEKRIRAMTEAIAEAQQAGELRRDQDPYKLARQMVIALAGGAAMAKGFFTLDEIIDSMNELIASWT